MNRKPPWISITILVVVTIAFGYYLFLAHVPVRVIDIHTLPMPIMVKNKALLPGQAVPVLWDYEKYLDVVGTIRVQFVNEITYTLSQEFPAMTRKGKGKSLSYLFSVPASLPPGYYHCNIAIDYPVNRFRTETVRFKTEQFSVVPLKLGG